MEKIDIEQEEIRIIAKKLNKMVESMVNEKFNDNEELRYKKHYEAVMHELNRELESANQMIDDYKENGFTLNALEMEGYRRGLTTMINEFNDWEKYLREERLLNLGIE
jgi:soluble cytochrome b562